MKKIKKLVSIGIMAALLVTSISIVISGNSPSGDTKLSVGNENSLITVEYSFDIPQLDEIEVSGEIFTKVQLSDGASYSGEPGEPVLPVKGCRILLPYTQELEDVQVVREDEIVLSVDHLVEPGQQFYPLNCDCDDGVCYTPPNPDIYGSVNPFPGVNDEISTIQQFRGYNILILRLYPVQYKPSTGQIVCAQSMEVQITTKAIDPTESEQYHQNFRGLQKDIDAVKSKVDNPSVVSSYPGPFPSHTYEYVIITSEALKNYAGEYNFQALRDAKIAKGLNAKIVTVEEIYADYEGPNKQAKIRNFIKDAYNNWHTDYVLLGGDDDVVPVKKVHVSYYSYQALAAADVYYACLDENPPGSPGNEDLKAEVYVGRACVGSNTEVHNFVKKTLAYMDSNDNYLKNALWVGEYLFGPERGCPTRTWGKDYKNEMIEGSSANGNTTVGIPVGGSHGFNVDYLYEKDGNWGKSDIMSRINNGVHLLNHLGHGSTTGAMKMRTSDCLDLTNNKYGFFYSQTCLAGHFDGTDCFAEYLTVKTDHGAFAVIMNSEYGWGACGSTNGPSQHYDREFWDAIFGEGILQFGKANQDSKEDNLWRIDEGCMRWCYMELNLFGDPALEIKGILPELAYSPDSHDFGKMEEGEEDSTTFEIWNSAELDTELHYSFSENCDWVNVSPTSGTSTDEHDLITVYINTDGLQGYNRYDIEIISDGGHGGVFTVEVQVGPCLESSPESYHFGKRIQGETDSTTFDIWNSGIGTLTYSLSEYYDWVDVTPNTGDVSIGEYDTITVIIDTTGLPNGYHSADIIITSNGGNGVFTIEVAVGPTLDFSPKSYILTKKDLETGDSLSTNFEIWNQGIQVLEYSIAEDCDWMTVSPSQGTCIMEYDTITIDFNADDVAKAISKGIKSWDIVINSNGGIGVFNVKIIISTSCIPPPSPPEESILLSPENGATVDDLAVEMSAYVYHPDKDLMTAYFYNYNNGFLIGVVPNIDDEGIVSMNWQGLEPGTTYKWYVVVRESYYEHEEAASKVYTFTIAGGNQAPYEPSSPSPGDEASEVGLDIDFSWSCNDPEGDPLTYDVYFGIDHDLPLVKNDLIGTIYSNLPGLSSSTTYYWKIVAKDSHGHSTEGPVWDFTTKKNENKLLEINIKRFNIGKVSVDITNKDEEVLSGIEWNISVTGGLLGRIDTSDEGIIETLDTENTAYISTGLESTIFGLGKIEITTTVTINNEVFSEKSNGFIIGKMIFILYD